MKIEKVSESIIKITISMDDLEERNIDLETFNYNSPAVQKLFWDMMEQAELQFGVSTQESQLCIEADSDLDDGFIVTITRIDEDGDFESIHKYIKNRFKKNELKSKRRTQKLLSTLLLYSFDDLDDVCSLSRNICSVYTGESTLYKLHNTYYLLLAGVNTSDPRTKHLDVILGEYGSRVTNVNFFEGYLNEYGEKIIDEDAVKVLNEFY